MKGIGCLLMVSGWAIALAALVLLPQPGTRFAFVVAGIAVEGLGLGLVAQAYRAAELGEGKLP